MKYDQYLPDADHFKGYGIDREDADVNMHFESQRLSGKWTPVIPHGFDDNSGQGDSVV